MLIKPGALLVFLVLTFTNVPAQRVNSDSTVRNIVAKHQVLLTNAAVFKNYRNEMSGASAFLLNYKNKVYAITAKHLLGRAMGIEPEIKAGELNQKLIHWKLFPRVPVKRKIDTVKISPGKMDYNLLDTDILLLEVLTKKFNALPLTACFTLPQPGDTLYLVGCPYREVNCRQNIYKVVYTNYDQNTAQLFYTTDVVVDFTGFSGAPILNAKGDVVSVLTRGWDNGNTRMITATFIKEIQKVK